MLKKNGRLRPPTPLYQELESTQCSQSVSPRRDIRLEPPRSAAGGGGLGDMVVDATMKLVGLSEASRKHNPPSDHPPLAARGGRLGADTVFFAGQETPPDHGPHQEGEVLARWDACSDRIQYLIYKPWLWGVYRTRHKNKIFITYVHPHTGLGKGKLEPATRGGALYCMLFMCPP